MFSIQKLSDMDPLRNAILIQQAFLVHCLMKTFCSFPNGVNFAWFWYLTLQICWYCTSLATESTYILFISQLPVFQPLCIIFNTALIIFNTSSVGVQISCYCFCLTFSFLLNICNILQNSCRTFCFKVVDRVLHCPRTASILFELLNRLYHDKKMILL